MDLSNKTERFFLCRQCYSFEPYDGIQFKSCSKCDLTSFLNDIKTEPEPKPETQQIQIQQLTPQYPLRQKIHKIEGYSYKKSINHNMLLLK